MRFSRVLAGVFAILILVTAPAPDARARRSRHRSTRAGSPVILQALHDELARAQTLKMEGFESPYFVSYLLRDGQHLAVDGKYGAVYNSVTSADRVIFADVRVGDYQFDSSGAETFGFNYNADFDYGSVYNYVRAPVDDDPIAIRDALWLLTDYKYKEALQAWLSKKAKKVYTVEEKKPPPDLSREKPAQHRGNAVDAALDVRPWEKLVREVGEIMRDYPEVFDSGVTATVTRTTEYFVNSEGAEIVQDKILYAVSVNALTRSEDGTLLSGDRVFYGRHPKALPDEKALKAETRQMVRDLLASRKAEAMQPYSGPAILLPRVTGVFFHEAIGHRLEGKRQRSEDEGQTFKGKVGQPIIPPFLSVVDDPSLATFQGQDLNGYYEYDDEGVRAQPVTLIDKGILRNYLMGRSPIEGSDHSNGHGRNSAFEVPMARMGNLIVRSTQEVSTAELEARLLAEVRRQGKPFGIIIEEIEGGETSTARQSIQAFRGLATRVWKVDAKTGQKTLVRGVEFIGTPLTSINKILATSDQYEVFNGFCGAESGFIPVSTVAPAVLLSEIELQKSSSDRKKPPILPPPAFDGPGKRE